MDVKELTLRRYKKLNVKHGITIEKDKAFKICPEQALEVMRVVDIYKDRENVDLLLPNMYLAYKGMFVGYGMKYLSDYVSVGDALMTDVVFDRINVVKKVLNVVFDLLDHGVNYIDMHVYNVLIKGDDVKVIDISDVSLEEGDVISYGLVDFIFNTLYGDNIRFFRLRTLIEDDRFTKYFTYEFMEYVRLVIEYKREVDARKILSYIPELEDEEKNKNIRKIVKKIDDESNRKYGV